MRKTAHFTVSSEGRDKGKEFIITELPAWEAEEWAIQAFLALASCGIEVPDDVKSAGFAALAGSMFDSIGKLDYQKAKPLLDKMMDCVKFIPDPKRPNVTRALVPDDIEEVKTRLELRLQVWKLHAAF